MGQAITRSSSTSDGDAGQAYVREALEPLPLDFWPLQDGVIRTVDGWSRVLLSTNRALTIPTTGEQLPYETMNVGALWRVASGTSSRPPSG